jgi:hypothetical protein
MSRFELKIYVFLGVVLIVGTICGYVFGSGGKSQIYQQAYQTGLEKGRTEVEQEYQKKIEIVFPSKTEPTAIYSVSGKVTKIENQTLTLESSTFVSNPLEEPKTETRFIKITDSTEFVKQTPKSPETLIAEERAFTAGERETPPPLYNEETVSSSEIQIGDNVIVEAGEDIKGKTSFEAEKIILMSAS